MSASARFVYGLVLSLYQQDTQLAGVLMGSGLSFMIMFTSDGESLRRVVVAQIVTSFMSAFVSFYSQDFTEFLVYSGDTCLLLFWATYCFVDPTTHEGLPQATYVAMEVTDEDEV